GIRKVNLTREIFVERSDYMDDAPKKWFRLAPGAEVRLRGACLIRCKEAKRDPRGSVTELVCTWDPDSKGGAAADGRKVRGTLHWISSQDAVSAEVRLYDRLFSDETPDAHEGRTFLEFINPDSEQVMQEVLIPRDLAEAPEGTR